MVTSGMSYAVHYELSSRPQSHEFLQGFSRMRIDSVREQPVLYVAMATWIPKCNMFPLENVEPEDTPLEIQSESSKIDHKKDLPAIDALCEDECADNQQLDEEMQHASYEVDCLQQKNEDSKNVKLVESFDLNLTEDIDTTRSDDSLLNSSTSGTPKKLLAPNKKVLTPKQIQKKMELEKKRQEREERERKKHEERERLKLLKQKEKQAKDEIRNKEKMEKQEQKQKELEQKQKEKELKEEQKRKEKEEREQKRKEKEEKEEQKKKEKELERIRKQQELEERNKEKLKLEEQKQKAAAAFVNFFVPKKSDVEDKKVEEKHNCLFKNFEVKSDMRLPPKRRNSLTAGEKNELIEYIRNPNKKYSYLEELRNKKYFGKCGKTWSSEDPLDEVVIIEDDNDVGETICEEKTKSTKLKAKFLKFHENQRPPYFGTWRKRSNFVTPKRPFAQDKDIFNYEEDSDDDWEEEEQGESLDDSDGDDKENETANDDYEVDNDFFVPHGHLSDDEIDDEATAKLSPESQKQKLKLLKDEFDQDMKSKTNKIKPRFIGCIWYNKEGRHVDEPIDRYLTPLQMISNGVIVIKKRSEAFSNLHKKKLDNQLKEFDASLIPEFISLVHGNTNKRKRLVTEFLRYMNENGFEVTVSKAGLSRKIKQIAQWMKCPEDGPMYNKFCWYVPSNIRKKYNVELTLPNQWEVKIKE